MAELADSCVELGRIAPVLVFATHHQPLLFKKLKETLALVRIPCTEVLNENDALVQRNLCRNLYHGVWLIDRDFHRGFDLKLSVDSTVIIYDAHKKLSNVEAKQMVGRASRAMGAAYGRIYIVDEANFANAGPIDEYLQTRELIE